MGHHLLLGASYTVFFRISLLRLLVVTVAILAGSNTNATTLIAAFHATAFVFFVVCGFAIAFD